MKYGFVLPRGDARVAVQHAQAAEEAGWDGFFVWEGVWSVDAWVALTAAAMRTERIRLGTLITPLPRMRPWKLAAETATLDHLSGGRVILSVGLGALDTGYEEFGEETDRKTRAELLDEGLDILTGLWRGQPFRYDGKHYHVRETDFPPPPKPVQQPRITTWVVGAWPRSASMKRALRYDGVLPMIMEGEGHGFRPATPEDIRQIKAYVAANRMEPGPFDIVVEGLTPGEDRAAATAAVRPWAEAGATWWIEAMWDSYDLDAVLARIRQGPPGV